MILICCELKKDGSSSEDRVFLATGKGGDGDVWSGFFGREVGS